MQLKLEQGDGLWKIVVSATTAEQARAQTHAVHGRPRVYWVQDTIDEVLRAVERKRRRAEQNPELYAERISKYIVIEEKIHGAIDMEEPPSLTLLQALAWNEDQRLQDEGAVCALWVTEDQWIVFGKA